MNRYRDFRFPGWNAGRTCCSYAANPREERPVALRARVVTVSVGGFSGNSGFWRARLARLVLDAEAFNFFVRRNVLPGHVWHAGQSARGREACVGLDDAEFFLFFVTCFPDFIPARFKAGLCLMRLQLFCAPNQFRLIRNRIALSFGST